MLLIVILVLFCMLVRLLVVLFRWLIDVFSLDWIWEMLFIVVEMLVIIWLVELDVVSLVLLDMFVVFVVFVWFVLKELLIVERFVIRVFSWFEMFMVMVLEDFVFIWKVIVFWNRLLVLVLLVLEILNRLVLL